MKANDLLFYLLFTVTLGAIFFTHPFMVYPFDIYTHLEWIDIQNINSFSPAPREAWHYTWASIFDLFHIAKNDIFQRASIIHYTQLIIIFGIIFYLSRVLFNILFKHITSTTLNYLAYWSTLIWFTIYSTFSVHSQQVWIAWYSVNYQITLPFTLLILAFTLIIVFESHSKFKKSLYSIGILIFSYFIIKLHAMEYIYYLMYLSILILVHLDVIFKYIRKNLLLFTTILILTLYTMIKVFSFIKAYIYRDSPLLQYFTMEKFPLLLIEIKKHGAHVIQHYNKADTTINELIILSLFFMLVFACIFLIRRYKHQQVLINTRIVLFLFITSLFIFIPLFTYSAGLVSLLTYDTVSHRFYYSSLLFLLIPAFVYYLFSAVRMNKLFMINSVIILILGYTLYYSKHFSEHANYYKNVHSLTDMFIKEKMDFNLHQKDINAIGKILNQYEKNISHTKPLYYYARDDIAFVIHFIYRKPVFYQRRGTKDYQQSYTQDKNTSHKAILFETPISFPSYKRFY